jgi:muramidase (phage lysozyme)
MSEIDTSLPPEPASAVDTRQAPPGETEPDDQAEVGPKTLGTSKEQPSVSSAAADQEGQATDTAKTANLSLKFMDFGCDPIEGLKFRVRDAEGKVLHAAETPGDGTCTVPGDLQPGLRVDIEVWRELTKDYKSIGAVELAVGEQHLECVSPKIRLGGETQALTGSPGNADKQLPEPPNVTRSTDSPTALTETTPASHPAASAASGPTSSPTKDHSRAPAPVPAPATAPAPRASTTPAAGVRREPQYGRDNKGHPVAAIVDDARNWLQQKVLAPLAFWTNQHFAPGATSKPTAGHPAINPPTLASSQRDDPAAIERLNKLIEFQETWVLRKYPKGTVTTLAAFEKGKQGEFATKAPSASEHHCLQYVKVALFKNGYADGISDTDPARKSGKDLLHFGFSEVTSMYPQVEVLMYDGSRRKQPDLVYAVPGDVIVYDSQEGKSDHPGHIDIRTYHGFCSDFFWLGARNGFPDNSKYPILGIYRKYSDTNSLARLNAFLKILRELETRGFAHAYHALHDPSGKTHFTFQDESKHPYQDDPENRAAGAYQIKWESFRESLTQMHWAAPKDKPFGPFNPAMQDRVAIYRLQYRKTAQDFPRRTALGYILQGEVMKALKECKLFNEWSVLPGSKKPLITEEDLQKKFYEYAKHL